MYATVCTIIKQMYPLGVWGPWEGNIYYMSIHHAYTVIMNSYWQLKKKHLFTPYQVANTSIDNSAGASLPRKGSVRNIIKTYIRGSNGMIGFREKERRRLRSNIKRGPEDKKKKISKQKPIYWYVEKLV